LRRRIGGLILAPQMIVASGDCRHIGPTLNAAKFENSEVGRSIMSPVGDKPPAPARRSPSGRAKPPSRDGVLRKRGPTGGPKAQSSF